MPLRGKVCLFVTIVLNSLLTQTLRVTARDADRWRILLKRDWLPTFCNAVFTVGNVALAVLIALSMMPAFGLTFSVMFAAVAVLSTGFDCTPRTFVCCCRSRVAPRLDGT